LASKVVTHAQSWCIKAENGEPLRPLKLGKRKRRMVMALFTLLFTPHPAWLVYVVYFACLLLGNNFVIT
jgi:hypothetical protein